MPAPHRTRSFETDPAKLDAVARKQIVTLAEAVELSSLSDDTWRRHHRDKLIPLAPGRLGVRLEDALFLPDWAPDSRGSIVKAANEIDARTETPGSEHPNFIW